MRRYLLWFSIITLGFISCQQEDNTPPSNPASTMTPTEQALVGKWYCDSMQYYTAGNLSLTNNLNATLDLKSSYFNGYQVPSSSGLPQMYDCIITSIGTYLQPWYVNIDNNVQLSKLTAGGPFFVGYIRVLTSSNFEITEWSGTIADGRRYYFHKL